MSAAPQPATADAPVAGGDDAYVPPSLPAPPVGGFINAYAIFEGGGAKGITHVGALAALEHERIRLAGVAGSSAGAIVAALIAAGYTAAEIFDPVSGKHILNKDDPVALIGKARWDEFGMLVQQVRRLPSTARWAGIAILVVAAAVALAWLLGHPGVGAASFLAGVAGLGIIALLLRRYIGPLIRERGFFDSAVMRDRLDTLLRDKLELHYRSNGEGSRPAPRPVRFRDLDPILGTVPQCRQLKIIVSDAGSRKPEIFDIGNPDAVVADAVAASSAIPFVFRAPAIRGARGAGPFVDGGLVANLPVWAFAREKRRLERDKGDTLPIFAFTLDDEKADPVTAPAKPDALKEFFHHLTAVVRTGIFGSQAVVHGLTPDLVLIPLPSPLKTLAFDCLLPDARKAHTAGLVTTARELATLRLTSTLLQTLLDDFLARARAELTTRKLISANARVRACLIDPVDPYQHEIDSFRVIANAGMGDDTDDRLLLDGRGPGAPAAWQQRRMVFENGFRNALPSDRKMTKYEKALIWPKMQSLIAVPVFARPKPTGDENHVPQRVACLDADISLERAFKDPQFKKWLADETVIFSPTLVREQINVLLAN